MNLLIVDDEPIIRKGLARMAEQYSLPLSAIRTANNGIDALEAVREQTPDVIFTDIRMPKMDGIELCRQIHERYDHIQLVVISGHCDFSYAQKCMSYGVQHYLLKPISKSDVHEVLDKIVKVRGKGYVSVTKYEDWIERVEEAIWLLKLDEVEGLTEEWKEHCLSSEMNLTQLGDLLEECIDMLLKRLERKPGSIIPEKTITRYGTKEEAFAAFDNQLKQMIADLMVKRSGNFKDPMKEAKAYIDSHLSKDITLDEVAKMTGLTPTYFSSIFKKMTNETFVQYRIKKRMERAQTLLAIPHMRIVDIAAEVGYEDYSHFTKMFKKLIGYSPSEYRSMLGIK